MRINVDQALARAEQRKNAPKPQPKIHIGKSTISPASRQPGIPAPRKAPPADQRDLLLKDLWSQMSKIKTDRGVASSHTYYLVREVISQLKQENIEKSQAFLDGELAHPRIAEHYALIQGFTDRAMELYDTIQYVERFGKLPETQQVSLPESESVNANALHYEIRRLDDFIYKTNKKIKGPAPKNPSRVMEWKEKLAMAEAQRDEKKNQLKKLQRDAREKES